MMLMTLLGNAFQILSASVRKAQPAVYDSLMVGLVIFSQTTTPSSADYMFF